MIEKRKEWNYVTVELRQVKEISIERRDFTLADADSIDALICGGCDVRFFQDMFQIGRTTINSKPRGLAGYGTYNAKDLINALKQIKEEYDPCLLTITWKNFDPCFMEEKDDPSL